MNTSVRASIGIPAELIALDRAPREQPSRRIQPQGLLHHLVGEVERLGGIEAQDIAAGAVRFGLELGGGLADAG